MIIMTGMKYYTIGMIIIMPSMMLNLPQIMKTQPDSRLGQRLHQIRDCRGLSQAQLARAIGVSVGTVQNYEHGRNPIPTDRLEPLAMALSCKPVELLAEPGSPTPRYRSFNRSSV